MFGIFTGQITTEDQIVDAYATIAHEAGDWIGLAELRDALPNLSDEQVNQALVNLAEQPQVWFTPEVNQKTLTQADRDAALWIGGEWRHLISITS